MAAPHPRLRKHLSAPGLLNTIREHFNQIIDHRSERSDIPLADALMSGLAVFGLKYPSLLKFDEANSEGVIRHNLNTLYGVDRAPCDTQMRTILDPVDPQALRSAFRTVHRQLQRYKALEAYHYLDGHYLVSIDGTGQFASSKIACPECCVKQRKSGPEYYHQLLAAVLVHPERKTVLALMPEAITHQDGEQKNDCERNAAKRLLHSLRDDFPQLPMIILEDSLASNGPHLQLLKELDLRYIIGVKEGDHPYLFDAVQQRLHADTCQELDYVDEHGVEYGYRFVNDLALNASQPDIRVNFLEHWIIDGDKSQLFTWITDLALSAETVTPIARGGRTRWKVENETFNTLKNQGYQLEHNYGHGQQHLATVFAFLMMLAFLIDQVQEHSCRLFQAARAYYRSRTTLWERLRGRVTDFYIPDWQTLWQSLAQGSVGAPLAPDTS